MGASRYENEALTPLLLLESKNMCQIVELSNYEGRETPIEQKVSVNYGLSDVAVHPSGAKESKISAF